MALDMLSSADYPMDRVKLVINHPTQVNSVKEQQVSVVTGCETFWSIPFDKAFIRAGQLGSPLIVAKPRSKGARSIVDLAYAISGGKREGKLFRQARRPKIEVQRGLYPFWRAAKGTGNRGEGTQGARAESEMGSLPLFSELVEDHRE